MMVPGLLLPDSTPGGTPAQRRTTARRAATIAALSIAAWCASPSARAAVGATGTNTSSASLDFTINIGKFIFFRIGSVPFPAVSTNVNTVSFNAQPAILVGPVTPVNGNSNSLNWSGAAPAFAITSSGATLPVEVRSNAGTVSIRASVVSALTSGANSIALSQILISSSDASLPAPTVPNTGSSAPVTVTGTAFSNLVTTRAANWTFSYNPAVTPMAGSYTGQISFTASSP